VAPLRRLEARALSVVVAASVAIARVMVELLSTFHQKTGAGRE